MHGLSSRVPWGAHEPRIAIVLALTEITNTTSNATIPCVGASGAIFGLLTGYATLFPQRRVTLLVFFILPVTMTARTPRF